MSSPKVTVIVPVYNVEAYIEKCARSLFEQTLDSLEIIFIDDCSPDKSADIIRRVLADYPGRAPLTRIIRMPRNSGQGAVRRHGILEATGDYIIHCDGDDWADPTLYEEMYRKALQTGADITMCDEVMEYADGSVPAITPPMPADGKAIMETWYIHTLVMFFHNKLVRRSLYLDNNVLPWPGLNMWEDNALFARLFYYAGKVAQLQGGAVYHYNRANVLSTTAGYGLRQVENMLDAAARLAEFYAAQPDGARFRKTVDAFKYFARINLVTDSFADYRRFRRTFPEAAYMSRHIRRDAFSHKGYARFLMVKYGLAPLFILMFKAKKMLVR